MKSRKATQGQLRRENRRLILRAVYWQLADNRADLAFETGLAKPTVSELVAQLIDEGYLIETGLGESTFEGGKRPRLLEFVPGARHIIGVSVSAERINGLLSDLSGKIQLEHYVDTNGAQGTACVDLLKQVINALMAQLDVPLLSIGIGVTGVVDGDAGIVRYAPDLGWQGLELAPQIREQFLTPACIGNDAEMAALGQFAFGAVTVERSLVTILVNRSVGLGIVLDGADHHRGSDIGIIRGIQPRSMTLADYLGWDHARQRIRNLWNTHHNSRFATNTDRLTYLYLRHAMHDGDTAALTLRDELALPLAQLVAWGIAALRPEHITIAGPLADLGDMLLNTIITHAREVIPPELVDAVSFSMDSSPQLVALGAAACCLQENLGLL